MSADPYAHLADFYDLAYGDVVADIPMYEGFARHCEGPLLELGVGTGRVAIPLARAGFEVWGIDTSPAMLERARRKGARLRKRLHLVQGDMRDFDLRQRFDLVICPASSFHHLLTSDEQLRCLACVRRHLAEGGLFVADLRSLTNVEWGEERSPALFEWARPYRGGTAIKMLSIRRDGASQTLRHTHVYDRLDAAGALRERRVVEFELRLVGRYEMEHLLARSGLELSQVYGDYDLGPYTAESEIMVVVARKPVGDVACS